jgi:hypothetical protein
VRTREHGWHFFWVEGMSAIQAGMAFNCRSHQVSYDMNHII